MLVTMQKYRLLHILAIWQYLNKRPMGLVVHSWPLTACHLYDIKLRFVPNGHVADVLFFLHNHLFHCTINRFLCI